MSVVQKTGLQTVNIPLAGLGSWQSAPGEIEKSIEWALEAGVRLIDTAYMYQNEAEIGTVLKRWLDSGKIKREDLFVVTKLPMMAIRAEDVEPYINRSLKSLCLDYVDLYLVHTPLGIHKDEKTGFIKFYEGQKVKYDTDTDHLSLWRAMERQVDAGKARSIGVSNFNSEQIERISKVARIPIAVNQVELYAYFQQKKLRETMDRWGVKVMSYGSLGSPGRSSLPDRAAPPNVLSDPLVLSLASAYGKTPAQVLLRHLVQLGIVVIPKSVKQARIKENFDLFDFELSGEDVARLNALDKGSGTRSFSFGFLKTDDDVTKLKEFPYSKKDEY